MTRAIALALTVCTGFSGLVYEVTWEKYLATLLGSHSEATAAVLALFLGGLALGYSLFGRLTRRLVDAGRPGAPPPLLRVYGGVEAGIGLYALGFPPLFGAVQSLSFALPATGSGIAFGIDVALSALLIAPPAVLMGATVPMLTQGLARSLDDATRVHALVYALNTLGAFAGALSAGFWLIPTLGLGGTLAAMAAVNLAAGAVFFALARVGGVGAVRAPEAHAERSGIGAWAFAALLVGFAMMALQTVLIRLGGLSLGASQFTFSMVVAVFVLCIALGSLAVSLRPRVPSGALLAVLWSLPVLLVGLYLGLEDAPYWSHVLRTGFGTEPSDFYRFHAAAFGWGLALLGIPLALSGATLPLFFHQLRREIGDLGDVAGRIYGWNTAGSLLGALLGGYVLLFWLDLHAVFRVAVAALVLAAASVSVRVAPRRRVAALAGLAAALAGLVALPRWDPERLASGLFRRRAAQPATHAGPDAFFATALLKRLLFYTDGPNSTVSVHAARGDLLRRSLAVNGKPDGAVPDDLQTNVLIGIVPALLAARAERAFVIGLGTGVTAGELAALDTMREVRVAEISHGVVEAAPYFAHANGDALHQPRLGVVHGDAFRSLVRGEGRYDVIASEPSNPWVNGVETLYSAEFLAAARDRLAPGGVFCQWLQTYELDTASVELVFRTYAAVFEHVAVWYGMGQDLLLLGLRDPDVALDLDRIVARSARPDFVRALAKADIDSPEELLAHELLPLDVVDAAGLEGPLHTLHHPRLSYGAARAFFEGEDGLLPVTAGLAAARVGERNSLLRRWAERHGGRLPEAARARAVSEVCEYRPRSCLTLLSAWSREVPDSAERARVMAGIRGHPRLSRLVPLQWLPYLKVIYGERPPPDGGDPLLVARSATETFETFYHHAEPFPREVLAGLWRRCERSGVRGERCARLRARVERRLGDLDEPLQPDLRPSDP